MENSKKLGIWMDHSVAHLIVLNNEENETKTIENDFTHADRQEALDKGESLMHNKRQQHQAAFYHKLMDEIIVYNDVLSFGPTDAKTELLNSIKADHRFQKIKISAEPADKMTDNQKLAHVKAYFAK